jgi:hypothetical protein
MPRRATCSRVRFIDWALIPPRPRTASWPICLFVLGNGEPTEGAGAGTAGWRLIVPGRHFERESGERTIVPSVRLGLLALADEGTERLRVSAGGQATW